MGLFWRWNDAEVCPIVLSSLHMRDMCLCLWYPFDIHYIQKSMKWWISIENAPLNASIDIVWFFPTSSKSSLLNNTIYAWHICTSNSNASVTSHSRAPYGLFLGCFEQKSYVHSWSPGGDRKGSVRAPYGQIRRPCVIFANYGCVNSLTCP